MRHRLLKVATLVLLLFPSLLSAQRGGFSVKVTLTDAESGAGVEFATVSLTADGSDQAYKYALTNEKGFAEIKGVRPGKYLIKGELMGYVPYQDSINVDNNLDMGKKKMEVDVHLLEGATVTDLGNPIVIKKDTIEHNIGLMKVTDNETLEDILKRLPGIEVSSDGTITANGKEIKKITIGGRTFFLDDPQLASKNIPAKIVEKVKVVERKSEQAEFTGIDDGEEETIIDLSVMKGMMNGWFGNFMAGGGSDLRGKDDDGVAIDNDFRFQGASMIAKFSESDHIAFIGNANNTNNRGFNDLAGNMMAGMRGGGMRGGGMRGGGMPGGWGGRSGISTSYMAGLNGSKTFDNKSELSGNYMFNGNERVVEESTAKTTFKQDGTSLFAIDNGYNITNSYGHRVGARADWKISDQTSILLQPQFNFGNGNFEERSDFSTDNISSSGQKSKINDGYSLSTGENSNQTARGFLLFRQRLGKPGRTISLNIDYDLSNNRTDGINRSLTNSYRNNVLADASVVDQFYHQSAKAYGVGGRLSYTEPLGRNFFAEATYSYDYNYRNSYKVTYDDFETGAIINHEYTNDITNESMLQRAGINIMKQEEKYNITVGATAQPSRTINVTEVGGKSTTIDRKVVNWAPNARVDFNFSDYEMLRFRYWGRTSQPSVTQLQTVPDNSNPQRVTLGNPYLDPSFSHRISMMYRKTNMETFSSLMVHTVNFYNQRNIVNASWYDKKGVQYTIPMNNDKGTFSSTASVTYNSPIAKSKFSVMSSFDANYSTGVSFVGKDELLDIDNPETFLNVNNFEENEYQNLSFSENLRFVYRDDIFEVSVGGNVRYSQAWYTITAENVRPTWTNNVNANVIANIPNIFNFSTDCAYTFYYGYEEGYNEPTLVWNAELSRQIFKNLILSIKCYDILNQSRNTFRTTTDNYVQDTRNNTLGRYLMVNLTYRFGNFGDQPIGGRMGGPGRGMGRGHGGSMRR